MSILPLQNLVPQHVLLVKCQFGANFPWAAADPEPWFIQDHLSRAPSHAISCRMRQMWRPYTFAVAKERMASKHAFLQMLERRIDNNMWMWEMSLHAGNVMEERFKKKLSVLPCCKAKCNNCQFCPFFGPAVSAVQIMKPTCFHVSPIHWAKHRAPSQQRTSSWDPSGLHSWCEGLYFVVETVEAGKSNSAIKTIQNQRSIISDHIGHKIDKSFTCQGGLKVQCLKLWKTNALLNWCTSSSRLQSQKKIRPALPLATASGLPAVPQHHLQRACEKRPGPGSHVARFQAALHLDRFTKHVETLINLHSSWMDSCANTTPSFNNGPLATMKLAPHQVAFSPTKHI